MKRWFPCLAGLVFALFGFVGRANAVLMLFDNGAPTGGVGHWISYKPDGIRPRIADDFVLPTDSAVTGVTFWTVESGDWDGVLEYYVFEDAGGLPSLTAKDSGNAVNISRQQTGSFTIGPQYRYSFNFEQPAFISGNQAHWLGLFVGTDTVNEGIFWETTAIGFSSKIVRAEFLAGAPIVRW